MQAKVDAYVKRRAFWERDRLEGAPVRNAYDEISEVMADQEVGAWIREQRLAQILEHAAAHTEFYRGYAGAALKDWPVLNKAQIMEVQPAHTVDPADIPGQQGDVYIQRTSGSTGYPFSVPQDTLKRKRRIAEIKWFNELVGFRSHEPLAQLRVWTQWHNKSADESNRENIFPVSIERMDDAAVEQLVDVVKREGVTVLRGYASWFKILYEYYVDGKGDPADLSSVKLIITHSEAMDEAARAGLEELLGCAVVECYSNEENGMFGTQLVGGGREYVLNHAGYIFEVLDFDSDTAVADGEMGRLVVTDLFNYAFPLIRYDTGDAAALEHVEGGWPVISRLFGRKMDIVYDAAGNAMQPMAFGRTLKNFPEIKQWQFAQLGKLDYALRLNLRPGAGAGEILASVERLLGEGAHVVVEEVDDIPVLASGKRKPVVQEWTDRESR